MKKEFEPQWEMQRKFLHSSIGFIIILLYYSNIPVLSVLQILFPITIAYAQFDYLRFKEPEWNLTFIRWLGMGMRPAERNRLQLTSSLHYLFGVCTVLLYFNRQHCLLSLLMLAWGDPSAAFVGKLYQKYVMRKQTPHKTLAGSLGAFSLGALIVCLFGKEGGGLRNMLKGGFVCAFGEKMSVLGLDDNFSMPIICAIGCSILNIN